MKKPRHLSRLAGFTKTDLQEIAHHLETHTYAETIAMIATRWKRDVPKSTLERFRKHQVPYLSIISATASVEVSADLAEYAATTQANFSASTLFTIEQQAFELALHRQVGDDLDEFKDLFLLIQKAKTTAVRERMAEIQDRKCRVRETESEHKIQRELKRDQKTQKEEEKKPLTPEQTKEIVWDIFGTPEEERARLRARNHQTAFEAPSEQNWEDTSEQASPFNPSLHPPENHETPSQISQMPNEKCSMPNAQLPPVQNPPPTPSPNPAIPEPLTSRLSPEALAAAVNNYTVRRAKEYWACRRSLVDLDPLARIPEYKSAFRECPCGSTLPCPHHEPFPEDFWTHSPHSRRYAEEFTARDFPYREPIECLS